MFEKMDNQLALPPHVEQKSDNQKFGEKQFYTGRELYEMGVKEIPMLVDPIFLKTGIMILSGSSDVGKSTILRQLTLSIITGQESFLGWQLKSVHKKVIYVSTEDDKTSISYLLNKTLGENVNVSKLENVRYVFNSDNITVKLDKMMEEQPVDCVIIDAFGDLYGGQLNQLNEVRNYFDKYFQLINRHNCLFIFLHHTGKKTEFLAPNKNNLIGSQGIEGKARQVIELRKDPNDSQYRHLCIVKGNYLPENMKTHGFKLKFNDDLTFEMTEERVDFNDLIMNNESRKQVKSDLTARIATLVDEQKMTFVQVAEALQKEGFNISKSTANNIYLANKKESGVQPGPEPEKS